MARTTEIRARCTPAVKEVLKALAAQEYMKPTDMVLYLITEEARKRGLWPPPENDNGRHHA